MTVKAQLLSENEKDFAVLLKRTEWSKSKTMNKYVKWGRKFLTLNNPDAERARELIKSAEREKELGDC